MAQSEVGYPLGTTDEEIVRLLKQAETFHNPPTKSLLQEAGIGPGMAVLDVGTGPGDVALIAAEAVGPTGRVVGLDRTTNFLDVARERVRLAGFDWVTFQQADLEDDLPLTETFDAVVGRFVLPYLKVPGAALQRLLAHLRPGGVAAFREFDWHHGLETTAPSPSVEKLKGAVAPLLALPFDTLRAHPFVGSQLFALLEGAGLVSPTVRLDAIIGGGAKWQGWAFLERHLGALMRVAQLTGHPEVFGEASAVGLVTQIRDELIAQHGVLRITESFGVVAQKPFERDGAK